MLTTVSLASLPAVEEPPPEVVLEVCPCCPPLLLVSGFCGSLEEPPDVSEPPDPSLTSEPSGWEATSEGTSEPSD